ncbi:TetR/AcrR family transcriptional regulator [Streptomyces sp. NPDC096132]|uniref:TetR/AcrR family transcriptional regulator n=1 Tax=Streptomyces sp. NPDC096132 TaxID=3366075 RepID=UPI0037F7BF2E
MAAAVQQKGYAKTTISDIARHARVSKRTFYSVFPDKEACLLATYADNAQRLTSHVEEVLAQPGPRPERLGAAVEAYLGWLADQPAVTRTHMLEIYAAGEQGFAVRRSAQVRWADLIARFVEADPARDPSAPGLSSATVSAVAGGIAELVLEQVEQGRTAELRRLKEDIVGFIEMLTGST